MTRAREKALEESGLSHGHITEAISSWEHSTHAAFSPSLYGDACQIICWWVWRMYNVHPFAAIFCQLVLLSSPSLSLSLSCGMPKHLMHFTFYFISCQLPDGRPLALLVVNRTWWTWPSTQWWLAASFTWSRLGFCSSSSCRSNLYRTTITEKTATFSFLSICFFQVPIFVFSLVACLSHTPALGTWKM